MIALLYRKRIGSPEQPFMTLKEFEDLLGVPKEHLEFTLWYLREGQYIVRTDNGRHSITMKGVDLAETMSDRRTETRRCSPRTHELLSFRSRVSSSARTNIRSATSPPTAAPVR